MVPRLISFQLPYIFQDLVTYNLNCVRLNTTECWSIDNNQAPTTKMNCIRRFFARRRLRQQVSEPTSQTHSPQQTISPINMFSNIRTVIINGGIFNMISVVISKFSYSSPHSITTHIKQCRQPMQEIRLQVHLKKVPLPVPLVLGPVITMRRLLASQLEEGNHIIRRISYASM